MFVLSARSSGDLWSAHNSLRFGKHTAGALWTLVLDLRDATRPVLTYALDGAVLSVIGGGHWRLSVSDRVCDCALQESSQSPLHCCPLSFTAGTPSSSYRTPATALRCPRPAPRCRRCSSVCAAAISAVRWSLCPIRESRIS